MKPGDNIFYWDRHKGAKYSKLIVGRIRSIVGKYAKIVALNNAPSGFGVRTVAVSRLKPLSELLPK